MTVKLKSDFGDILKSPLFPPLISYSIQQSHSSHMRAFTPQKLVNATKQGFQFSSQSWLLIICQQSSGRRHFLSCPGGIIQVRKQNTETMHLLKEQGTGGWLGWDLNRPNFLKGISDGSTVPADPCTGLQCLARGRCCKVLVKK